MIKSITLVVALWAPALLALEPNSGAADKYYCSYTGIDRNGESVYVKGPKTYWRPEAKPLALQACQSKGLRNCTLYGCFKSR